MTALTPILQAALLAIANNESVTVQPDQFVELASLHLITFDPMGNYSLTGQGQDAVKVLRQNEEVHA